jgi:ribosome biogenesis GTPase A/vacuolar-type H+-ATPase subunit H
VNEETDTSEVSEGSTMLEKVQSLHVQPIKDMRGKTNRYVLQFNTESPSEIRDAREKARASLEYATEEALEIDDNFFDGFDLPKRPPWSFNMKKETVLANEERDFFKYVTNIEKAHFNDMKKLSYFELNIETWRQLWRVLEISDIIIMIVDCRFPTLLFPPYVYNYIKNELKKEVIILFNKIDLVESAVVLAWKKFYEEKYKIPVVLFTSYPAYNLRGSYQNKQGLNIRRRKGKMKMASEGAMEVYKACLSIVKSQVDLSKWHDKIQHEMSLSQSDFEDEDDEVQAEHEHSEEKDFDFEPHEQYKNGILSIGTIGFTNVGKSSLINALMGKKVVSISRSPGHTKHFQTIFLTENVRLVDCPGLVFPSKTPKVLQVLLGSYPIAQLREPYASIKFLAERVNLPQLLVLKHPDGDDEWSAMDICDAFALKRGFLTAKAARPDTYRAANSILRMALDGKIALSLKPCGFHAKKKFWETHEELRKVEDIQALGKSAIAAAAADDYDYLSDSGDENAQRPTDYLAKGNKKRNKDSEMSNEGDDENDDDDTDCEAATSFSNPFDLLNDGNSD